MTEFDNQPQPLSFEEFARLLQQPDFVPPEYTFAPDIDGGFTAPGCVPIPHPREHQEERIRRKWSAEPGPNIVHLYYQKDGFAVFHADGYTPELRIPCDEDIQSKLGSRSIAVELAEDGDKLTIQTVYGVEPRFTGEISEDMPDSLLVEGRVVGMELMDVSPFFKREFSQRPVPMVAVQVDPQNEDSIAWIPCKTLTTPDAFGKMPMMGDAIQLRGHSPRQVTIPGSGETNEAILLSPSHLLRDDSFLMEEGETRRELREIHAAETSALIETIQNSSPQVVAQALGRYLRGRLTTYFKPDAFGTMELANISIEQYECEAIVTAVQAREFDPSSLPVCLDLIANAFHPGSSSIEFNDVCKATVCSVDLIMSGHLSAESSILDLTAQDLESLVRATANQAIPSGSAPGLRNFRPLLELLDQPTRESIVTEVITQLDEQQKYGEVLRGHCYDLLADLREHASTSQQEHIDRQLCRAIETGDDLTEFIQSGYRLVMSHNLLDRLFDIAKGAVFSQNEGSPARNDVPEAVYQGWLETSREFLAAIDRAVGDGELPFDYDECEIIAEVRELLTR